MAKDPADCTRYDVDITSSCPKIGSGGFHSDSYGEDDNGACHWCGQRPPQNNQDPFGLMEDMCDDPEVLLQEQDDEEYERYQTALQGTPEYWSELCDGWILQEHPGYRASHGHDYHDISGTISN